VINAILIEKYRTNMLATYFAEDLVINAILIEKYRTNMLATCLSMIFPFVHFYNSTYTRYMPVRCNG
jgi:hypothetical protein